MYQKCMSREPMLNNSLQTYNSLPFMPRRKDHLSSLQNPTSRTTFLCTSLASNASSLRSCFAAVGSVTRFTAISASSVLLISNLPQNIVILSCPYYISLINMDEQTYLDYSVSSESNIFCTHGYRLWIFEISHN